MANAGIGNAYGAIPVFDGGAPKAITGYARSIISGGAFVYASGADNVVDTTNASFATADILFTSPGSAGLFNGIAAHTAASGEKITIYTEGVFQCVANGAVVAGTEVKCDGLNSVQALGSTATTVPLGHNGIGRALTNAASGGACLVYIRA